MNRFLRNCVVTAIAATTLVSGTGTVAQGALPRPAPAEDAVRVATYNVCKKDCGRGRFSWGKRRNALVRAVRRSAPDVLAVQEANTQKWRGVRHIDDVRRLLNRLGYEIASTDYDRCTEGCTRGAHIFYNTRTMHPASPRSGPVAGMAGLSTISGTGFGPIQDRNASWAFLTPYGSGRPTLYMSVHLPTEKTALGEQLRVAAAGALRPWADGLIRGSGLTGVDLVVAGDLNSYQARQPNGAQQVLANAGLVDGYNAPDRANPNFGTVNYTPVTRRYKGFPPRPYFYRNSVTRIDYVFATVQPLRHEVVVYRTRKGTFDNRYRASDHNMVMVDLPLR